MSVAASTGARPPTDGGVGGASWGHATDLSGAILFARYAFGPNRLGLCGPADWPALRDLGADVGRGSYATDRATKARTVEAERAIGDLARGFEGAYPYLRLIAEANGIADPLHRDVVDAYWLGNVLSDRVEPASMIRSIDLRFRSRVTASEWRWLESKPLMGARPTHAFHVLDVFPRAGLMSGGHVSDVLALIEACRIRWGTVIDVGRERLIVEAPVLEMSRGRLVLSEPRVSTVRHWLDSRSGAPRVEVGDIVSLHWDWACEVLQPDRAAALAMRTRAQIRITNRTI